MSWLIFIVVYVFAIAVANILRKVLVEDKRSDAIASAIIFQFLGTAIVAVVALIHGFKMPPITEHPLNFIFQACLWGLSTASLFKAYQYSEASEVTIIITTEALFTIIAAALVFGEVLSPINLIGMLLIITSVVIISYAGKKLILNKGFFFALGCALFSGFGIVNDTFLLHFSDTLSLLTIGFLTPGIFILLTNPSAAKKIGPLLKPSILIKNFIFTSVFVFAAITFYFSLASGGQVAQVNAIAQASVISTVILATIFLNERDHLAKKFICAMLVTVGVILLR